MDSPTYAEMQQELGPDLLTQLHAQIDESVPTGVVEQRAPGRPTVRMSAASFVQRSRAEVELGRAIRRTQRKRERQNRAAGRRQRG